jgi:hypothetical protein
MATMSSCSISLKLAGLPSVSNGGVVMTGRETLLFHRVPVVVCLSVAGAGVWVQVAYRPTVARAASLAAVAAAHD